MNTYQWEVERFVSEQGFPVVRLRKDGQWVETHGEPGMSLDILFDRALVVALQIDVDRCDEAYKPFYELALEAAILRDQAGRRARKETP